MWVIFAGKDKYNPQNNKSRNWIISATDLDHFAVGEGAGRLLAQKVDLVEMAQVEQLRILPCQIFHLS